MSKVVPFKRRHSRRRSQLRPVRSGRPLPPLGAMLPVACLVLVAALLAAKESALIPGLSPSHPPSRLAIIPHHWLNGVAHNHPHRRATTGMDNQTSVESSFPTRTFGSVEVAGQPTSSAINRGSLYVCSSGDRHARGTTCIVDGDTGWENGVKWRLVDKDAPELSHPACNREYRLAVQARDRLLQLMSGGYVVEPSVGTGRYGRQLVRIRLSSGAYAGDVLLREGLAQLWPNTGNIWCSR